MINPTLYSRPGVLWVSPFLLDDFWPLATGTREVLHLSDWPFAAKLRPRHRWSPDVRTFIIRYA